MASFNRVFLMGYLTRDPEQKYLTNGQPVCNFGVAMNETYTDRLTGEKKENATFVDCEAWDRNAETITEYLTKGSPIFIEGSLKYEQWEQTDGTKRSRLKIRVMRFQFVGSKQDAQIPTDDETQDPSQQTTPPAANNTSTEDDIPF